jgi:branched-chain amino acid transport system substrate-binding protein
MNSTARAQRASFRLRLPCWQSRWRRSRTRHRPGQADQDRRGHVLVGAAAGPFGVPARNGAEVVAETLNAGKLPAPYATAGFGGTPIEIAFVDEAGGTTKQVNEYRNLVQRDNADVVIGYISSGDCLAIAPLAEELKRLTVFFDCGTPRIFEDASYKYLFRTGATATMDNTAAALYVTEMKPALKKVAGINQNYAWARIRGTTSRPQSRC